MSKLFLIYNSDIWIGNIYSIFMLRMKNHKSALVKPKLANYTIQALMEIQKAAIKLQITCSNI